MISDQFKGELSKCILGGEVADLIRPLYKEKNYEEMFEAIDFYCNEVADISQSEVRSYLYNRIGRFTINYLLPNHFESLENYIQWQDDYEKRNKKDVVDTIVEACTAGPEGLRKIENLLIDDIEDYKAK